MPHLEFAIAVEDLLSVHNNRLAKTMEYYDSTRGVTIRDDGDDLVKGGSLSDALSTRFARKEFRDQADSHKIRLVNVSDSPLFKHGPTLGAIGQLVKQLHYPSEMVAPLDTSPHLHTR